MNIEINHTYPADRDTAVAQLWAGNELIAEVVPEESEFIVEVAEAPWKLPCDQLISALEGAKELLEARR